MKCRLQPAFLRGVLCLSRYVAHTSSFPLPYPLSSPLNATLPLSALPNTWALIIVFVVFALRYPLRSVREQTTHSPIRTCTHGHRQTPHTIRYAPNTHTHTHARTHTSSLRHRRVQGYAQGDQAEPQLPDSRLHPEHFSSPTLWQHQLRMHAPAYTWSPHTHTTLHTLHTHTHAQNYTHTHYTPTHAHTHTHTHAHYTPTHAHTHTHTHAHTLHTHNTTHTTHTHTHMRARAHASADTHRDSPTHKHTHTHTHTHDHHP